MADTFTCPHCRKSYKTGGKSIGKRVKCKQCDTVFTATADNIPPKEEPEHDTGKNPSIRVDDAPDEKTAVEDNTVPEYTIDDAKSLWQDAVGSDQSDGMSIKSEKKAQVFSAGATASIPSRNITKQVEGQPGSNDFELVKVIGKGGMGAIFSARQASMDRDIAVKMILPEQAGSETTKSKFISEALVTGELDHPNIVPVYELGKAPDGTLFYAMKEVKGTNWKDVIKEKSESENLQILMDVCDAMAFSHDHGVVHRDLKPENIMLGDYGEVLVMDWGLAVCTEEGGKAEPITGKMSKAGTPAYMAPEMATCEGARLGPWSDIYLLGGILYEIVTGLKPHSGEGGIFACLYQAMENVIQESEVEGELKDIALKAMATDAEDRYASVKAFQEAVREYQSHLESIVLCDKAREDLKKARKKGDYSIYAKAVFGFEQAWELWDDNDEAKKGLQAAQLAYADCALERGDLDLAASQLDKNVRRHKKLATEVKKAQALRLARQKRVKTLTGVSIAAGIFIVVGAVVAAVWIGIEQAKTKLERDKAIEAREEEARQRELAQAERDRAEYEAYVGRLGLIEKKVLYDNAFDSARDLLERCPERYRHWEWGRLRYLSYSEALTLRGHDGSVFSLAYSPDGTRAVSGSWDKTAILWDLRIGRVLHVLQGHQGAVISVAFSHDGQRVLTGSADGTIGIWDANTGRALFRTKSVEFRVGHWLQGVRVAFSPDGTRFAGAFANNIQVWDYLTFKRINAYKTHLVWDTITSLVFTHDSKGLLVSQKNFALLLDAETGKVRFTFSGHKGEVSCVSISRDGELIATGSFDRTAVVWRHVENTWRKVCTLSGHSLPVRAVSISPNGKQLATAGEDNVVRLWDIDTGKVERRLKGHGNKLTQVVYSPCGKYIATSSADKTIKLWETDRTSYMRLLTRGFSMLIGAYFSPDGQHMLIACQKGGAKLLDIQSGKTIRRFSTHWLSDAAFSPRGDTIAIADSTGHFKGIQIWKTDSGKRLRMLSGHQGWLESVRYSVGGKWILSGSRDKTARLWETTTGKTVWEIRAHKGRVKGYFSPDGTKIITVSWDKTARIWDIAARRQLNILQHDSEVHCASFSPSGKQVATGCINGVARLWDLQASECTHLMRGHAGVISMVTFSMDGKRLLTAGGDGTARIWDASTGRELHSIKGHQSFVASAVFSPDGRRIVTASHDRSAIIWPALDWTKSIEELEAEKLERWKARWKKEHPEAKPAKPEKN